MKEYASGPGWTIIHGDALQVMAGMQDREFDLALTDPPYGVGIARRGQVGGGQGVTRFTPGQWDVRRPPAEAFLAIQRVSQHQIIWGGNYFADLLPPSRCWLVWHKKRYPNLTQFADVELAWTSLDANARIIRHLWDGFTKGEPEPRYAHPTQKPRRVMAWCLEAPKARPERVLDPYMGSGTTLEVCIRAGIQVVGIDQSEEYCELAARRADAVASDVLAVADLPRAA